jgi:hypothetical protein
VQKPTLIGDADGGGDDHQYRNLWLAIQSLIALVGSKRLILGIGLIQITPCWRIGKSAARAGWGGDPPGFQGTTFPLSGCTSLPDASAQAVLLEHSLALAEDGNQVRHRRM